MSVPETTPELILHRWPGRWALPSLSPECVAVESYLRLAGLRFAAEDCRTHYASPSGALPALDQNLDVVGGSVGSGETNKDPTGALARHRILDHLRRKVRDVDAHLSPGDAATLAAYTALCEHKLSVATAWYQWIDKDRFTKHTRPAYGAAFPAPLSHVLPWMWRRTQLSTLAAHDEDRVRDGLKQAYAALVGKLDETGGPYLLGSKPTSLDALAFAHLEYHARAPCMDVARGIMKAFPKLVGYVEAMEQSLFPNADGVGGKGGDAPGSLDSSSWREPPSAHTRGRRNWWGRRESTDPGAEQVKPLTAKERRFRRRSRWSVAIAAGAIVTYLFAGDVVTIAMEGLEQGEEEVGDEREGGDEGDDDDDDGVEPNHDEDDDYESEEVLEE